VLLPDGSTGTINLLATDTEGKTDGPVQVTFSVLPDNPPTNNGGGPLTFVENSIGGLAVATGDDLDVYDRSILSVIVLNPLPANGILSINGTAVVAAQWYSSAFHNNSNGEPSAFNFNYYPTEYVFGPDSFTVQFKDQLGATS
jgi:hypothetical protein